MSDSIPWNLLNQLEYILESDPLIDEIGFIHPSQFDVLNEEVGSTSWSAESISQSADKANISGKVLWSRDHKLGISTTALLPLCKAAKYAFMDSLRQYKMHTKVKDECGEGNVPKCLSPSLTILEKEVMKHSKAILLLSCDFGTAWNFRKLLVSEQQEYSMFMEELVLSDLVLSYSPKSERAWSHRRWVIKMIAGKCSNLQEIVDRESEFVKKLAERSKMNYRAWNHRCWLVAYMPVGQLFHELNKSREWAVLNVADNSCFHYRTRLMLRILEAFLNKDQNGFSGEELDEMWKDELDWGEKLIKLYVGREALWLHRRFLASCWIKHFASSSAYKIDRFIDNELQLFSSCATIIDGHFNDYQAQAIYAATYIMWLKKQIQVESLGIEFERLQVSGLKTLLNTACPQKAFLWDSLLQLCGSE
ncbi:PREDICTED: protein prenyltransferase alpha subunit repeat-containing protein 1-like isoform X2 [Ipomoea nil]|uniref:protein prenyltransferase alpha subunit repeat-containing protein 1-like isoform X2 n=1 Tax=Ipomoea nil TaxID=35883 RepID=UPI000900D91B|nr:PREDICTED: protein prenyltransferase alpha subunit repeat-containing protein 1-like isoform X2 [Ipomoea nil]